MSAHAQTRVLVGEVLLNVRDSEIDKEGNCFFQALYIILYYINVRCSLSNTWAVRNCAVGCSWSLVTQYSVPLAYRTHTKHIRLFSMKVMSLFVFHLFLCSTCLRQRKYYRFRALLLLHLHDVVRDTHILRTFL